MDGRLERRLESTLRLRVAAPTKAKREGGVMMWWLLYFIMGVLFVINVINFWGVWQGAREIRRIRRTAWEVIYLGDGVYNLKPPTSQSSEGFKVRCGGFMNPRQAVKKLSEDGYITLHNGGCLFVSCSFVLCGSPYWLQLYPRNAPHPGITA